METFSDDMLPGVSGDLRVLLAPVSPLSGRARAQHGKALFLLLAP